MCGMKWKGRKGRLAAAGLTRDLAEGERAVGQGVSGLAPRLLRVGRQEGNVGAGRLKCEPQILLGVSKTEAFRS